MGWYSDLNESIDEMFIHELERQKDAGFFSGEINFVKLGALVYGDLLTINSDTNRTFLNIFNLNPRYTLHDDNSDKNTVFGEVKFMTLQEFEQYNDSFEGTKFDMKTGFIVPIERSNGEIINIRCGTNFEIIVNDDKLLYESEVALENEHLRVETTDLESKDDAQAVIDGTLDQYRALYPEETAGMTDDELSIALFDSSYSQVVDELWGHASWAGQTIDFFIPGDKTSHADINAGDDDDFTDWFEKTIITIAGGGNPDLT